VLYYDDERFKPTSQDGNRCREVDRRIPYSMAPRA